MVELKVHYPPTGFLVASRDEELPTHQDHAQAEGYPETATRPDGVEPFAHPRGKHNNQQVHHQGGARPSGGGRQAQQEQGHLLDHAVSHALNSDPRRNLLIPV